MVNTILWYQVENQYDLKVSARQWMVSGQDIGKDMILSSRRWIETMNTVLVENE